MNHSVAGRWRINNEDLPVQQVQPDGIRQSLPEGLGEGYTRITRLDPDLSCLETNYRPAKDLAVFSRMDNPEPRMVVTLGLKGQSCFAPNKGRDIRFNAGYTTVTTFGSSQGERLYQAGQPLLQLRFSVSKQWVENYFGLDTSTNGFGNRTRLLSIRPTSPQALAAAHRLLANTTQAEIRKLALHAQVLTILADELEPIFAPQAGEFRLNPRETAIAHQARDLLCAEYKNPPSILALSRRVGTNPYKLKQLFHYCFNTTPYGLLLEIRMDKAYHLLQSTHCYVATAADAVGYGYASNFSAAFIKHFGVSPKQVARRQ